MLNVFKYQKSSIAAMLTAFLSIGFLGCKQSNVTPTAPSTSDVTFTVSWEEVDKAGYPRPESAKMWVYPATGLPTVSDVTNGQTIHLNLVQGLYKIIVANDDFMYLKRRDEESFDSHDIYLEVKPSSSSTPGWNLPGFSTSTKTNTYSMVDNADNLFTLTGNAPRVLEVQGGVNSNVELKPRPASSLYSVSLNITSDTPIKGGAAIVTGVATAISLSDAKLKTTTNVGMEFPLTKSGDNQLTGNARSLGVNPETAGSIQANVLAIRIDYDDPTKKPDQLQVDISEQFKDNVNVNLDVTLNVDVKNNFASLGAITIKKWTPIDGEDINPTEPDKK